MSSPPSRLRRFGETGPSSRLRGFGETGPSSRLRRFGETRPSDPNDVLPFVAACVTATLAFVAYTQTLLPGVDLGDTGGFQAAVLWPDVSARQAYPLYYALARPFVMLTAPDNPARALNLFSAVAAALAAGLLAWFTARVTASVTAGAAAGLLLAFSYTFWSQAIIAEVYALHLALVGAILIALRAWDEHPGRVRLAVFFGLYALAFGNHLSTVLLFLPLTAFLLRSPDRRAQVLTPAAVGLAAGIAAAGALQYAPNLLASWYSVDPSSSAAERFAAFWFDTTKADWRESMVLGIQSGESVDRLAMWWFDMRQQFGAAGVIAALAGAAALWRTATPWAALMLAVFGITAAFALTYNVGDAHVFFLPAHYAMAFFAGAAVGHLTRSVSRRRAAGLLVIAASFAYAGWRAWDTWPAVDRHDDRRAEQFVARLTLGITDGDALLVSGMNWQLDNALLYAARQQRRDLAWVRGADVLPHLPFLIEDNHRIQRDVVMTAEAAATATGAYGDRFPLLEDTTLAAPGLSEVAALVPDGAPYVMTILSPPREEPLDEDILAETLADLTGGRLPPRVPGRFEVIAGLARQAPTFYRSSDRPFQDRFAIVDEPFTVRMDSWLPVDTFRRPGFGHVLRGRDHILIAERGVSLVWLLRDRSPSAPFYAASVFAPKPRFRIPSATLQLARVRRLETTRPGPAAADVLASLE